MISFLSAYSYYFGVILRGGIYQIGAVYSRGASNTIYQHRGGGYYMDKRHLFGSGHLLGHLRCVMLQA